LFSEAPVPQPASIGDEPAVEVAHPPSERLDSSSATAASAVTFPSFDINAQHVFRGQSFDAASIGQL
jgi:hypothetical protein